MGCWWDELTPEKRAWLFKYNTPGQLLASLQSRGLDVVCTDPDTLAAAAKIQVAWEREREQSSDRRESVLHTA